MAGRLRDNFRGFQLMHWLARVFVSALARRIAYVLAAAFIAWLGVNEAHAQAKTCRSESDNCNVAEAQAACMSYPAGATNPSIVGGATRRQCPRYESSSLTGFFILLYWGNNSGGYEVGAFSEGNFYWRNACASEPSYTGTGPWSSVGGSARSGSYGCRNGCDGRWLKNADSSFTWSAMPNGEICPDDQKKACAVLPGHYWNPVLNVCEPPSGDCPDGGKPNSLGQCAPEPCPDGMAQQADGTCKQKESECAAGQIRSPDGKCLPGEGQCAAGEVRGPDGTCKKDRDGDGEPDEPGDSDSFSGGEDCSSPPSCSGSPIMCGQARIQWRIECNTRKNRNIAGGLCSAIPICTGEKCDALEYSQLLMQWRTACAVEKLASASNGGSGDNADTKAIRDALTGTNGSVATPTDRPASDVWSTNSGTPVKPDTSGYGFGRTCPQPPSIEVFGAVIAINTAPICNWLILGGYFVMGLAALASLRIMATRDA